MGAALTLFIFAVASCLCIVQAALWVSPPLLTFFVAFLLFNVCFFHSPTHVNQSGNRNRCHVISASNDAPWIAHLEYLPLGEILASHWLKCVCKNNWIQPSGMISTLVNGSQWIIRYAQVTPACIAPTWRIRGKSGTMTLAQLHQWKQKWKP